MKNHQSVRVLINGFGRIGRAFFRIAINDPSISIVGVNDKYLNVDEIVYLAKYDSVYGVFPGEIKSQGSGFKADGQLIQTYQSDNILSLPLSNIDTIVYSSGDHNNLDAQIDVINSSKCKIIFTSFLNHTQIQDFIFGYHKPSELKSKLISLNICDVVGVLPVYNFIRTKYQLQSASIITLHSYLSCQKLLDGKSEKNNFALGRSAINNLIPKTTSLESNLRYYFPRDHIMCMSYRVPTNSVSCASMHIVLNKNPDPQKIREDLENECGTNWKSIGFYSKDRCVSIDYSGTPYSFIIDHEWIECVGNQLRICLWYDQEWGYATRILDMIKTL